MKKKNDSFIHYQIITLAIAQNSADHIYRLFLNALPSSHQYFGPFFSFSFFSKFITLTFV
jgi:hypothetical protein